MSQADFKQSLRKLDFPACAKECLPRLESIISSRNKQNFAMQLISEFVFLERTKDTEVRKGQMPQSLMSPIQEFQLIAVLIEFFSQPGPDASRNAIFLSLFSSNLTPHRSKILCHLISTAVSGSVASLLSSAGTWMQQVGCTTLPSIEVAQSLVSDFITFAHKTPDQLKELPLVAPHFAANFMTAVADLYVNDQHGVLLLPPDALLDVFTEWVSENPALCMASQLPLALPSGAIAMPVVTPLAGLIRWTVLSPLVAPRASTASYSFLHVSLLKSLLHIESTGPPTALNAQHLALIVTSLQSYLLRLPAEAVLNTDDPPHQKSIERLAQAVQVALYANCVYGNIPQLLCSLETLPSNPLMQIVIKTNKSV